jgi:hypothetical protein
MKPTVNKRAPFHVKPSELTPKLSAATKRAEATAKAAKAAKAVFKQTKKKFKLAKKAAKAARREVKELKKLLLAARSAAGRMTAAKRRKAKAGEPSPSGNAVRVEPATLPEAAPSISTEASTTPEETTPAT